MSYKRVIAYFAYLPDPKRPKLAIAHLERRIKAEARDQGFTIVNWQAPRYSKDRTGNTVTCAADVRYIG
jgi:hypothetical protein